MGVWASTGMEIGSDLIGTTSWISSSFWMVLGGALETGGGGGRGLLVGICGSVFSIWSLERGFEFSGWREL